MTSQKSSISTFNFTFLSALKGNFILPLLNLVLLSILVPVTSAITIKGFSGNTYDPRTGALLNSTDKVTDLYKFLIFSEFGQISANIGIHLAVISFSVLLGVVMFRFIASKKTVNVFYSLGITRKNLFVSKYLAGILMLSVSIAIPFLACLFVNISTFGTSKELWSAIMYHIIGYCALSFTAFSLTAAVFSGVGTIIEGITFSGILMLGPMMVFYGIQFLMSKLTLGSPYGHFYDENYQVTNALATSFSRFNPILFLFKNVSKIGMLTRASKDVEFVWTAPDYTDTIVWFAVAAVLFFVGIFLFQKRKAEICGFLGVNNWLNFTVTFLIGFFALTVAVIASPSVSVGVLIGTGIFILIYAIIDFALIRNIKEWAKGLYKLPVHLGISLLVVFIFATGLFGYSSRIPGIDKIESAEIAPVTNSAIVNPFGYGGYSDSDFVFSYGINRPITGFKSAKDLEIITGLHKQIVVAGKLTVSETDSRLPVLEQVTGASVRITYRLKNGKTVNRYYNAVKMKTITDLLAIDETDRYRDLVKQTLTEPVSDNDSEDVKSNKNIFQSADSVLSIIPAKLNTASIIELTPEMRLEFLNALASDLTKQTAKERFFPETPAIGAVQFGLTDSNPKNEYGYMADAATVPSMQFLTGYGLASIVVTNDMSATIGFLEANGYMSLFENEPGTEFVNAQVISASRLSNNFYYLGPDTSLHFIGGWTKDSNEYGSFGGAYKTTDKAIVDEIAANAHISYFNSVQGYFVKFEIGNGGGYTTMYVPASKMPQSVIDAVDKHVQIRPDYPMEKYAY